MAASRPRGLPTSAVRDSASETDSRANREPWERLLPELVLWLDRRMPRSARRRSDPWDLVQDVWLSVSKTFSNIEAAGEARIAAYFRVALLNRVRDEIRRSRIGETESLQAHHQVSQTRTVLDDAITRESRRQLRAALRSLPERDRTLLQGRFARGLSFRKLASMAGFPSIEATRSATRRALLRLARAVAALEGPGGECGKSAGRRAGSSRSACAAASSQSARSCSPSARLSKPTGAPSRRCGTSADPSSSNGTRWR